MERPNNDQEPSSNTLEHPIDATLNDDETAKEIALQAVDLNVGTSSSDPATPFTIAAAIPLEDKSHDTQETNNPPGPQIPLIFITGPSCTQAISNLAMTTPPQRGSSNFLQLHSPRSIAHLSENEPQSLFLQALSKLNESSVSFAVVNNLIAAASGHPRNPSKNPKSPDGDSLKTPDSLTSAPPSYSFVLRQMSARRRPRLMGTFIPSPSFVNHTPPPNYAAAFDIYVENPIPPSQPVQMFDLGFSAMPAICTECGYTGITTIVSKVTMCTHCCAVFLCLFCCWLCVPLPYIMGTCKDVRHYCRNCGHYLGMYSLTNPEVYPAAARL